MADQNISQILAALAAQRPGGTPLQSQQPAQQPPPHAYPPSYPTRTPPVGAGGYPLPQPSSSGSLDLSNIRPSNSGSVSLANAVSKARGFAAEKGLSYGSSEHAASSKSNPNADLKYWKVLGHENDPRLAGRGYRRSRSRSRSPVRISRDGYRDNYNPYRDERRDDVRRGGSSYVRERSFSPGPRGRNYSPLAGRGYGGPGDRSPPDRRGGDDGQETIVIESSLVGLIIGRQGENLRRVENETQTRVQFMTGPESSGPQRHCKISGTRAARDNAKREINRIIAENGKDGSNKIAVLPAAVGVKGAGSHAPALRAGEDATQIMVPNRTVGLIIGRGGETIRDLQERSQCHVNIVGEEKSINGLRPVNLIGTSEAARMAKDLIMEIVESDTKNLSNQGGGNRDGGRAQNNFAGDDKINDNITVPSDAVGMIIGKGGETIKDMQQTTGCKINVSQPNGRDVERDIGLVGSRGAIEAAKRAIMDKVHAVEEKNGRSIGYRDPPRDEPINNNRSDPYSQNHNQQPYGEQPSVQPQATPAGDVDPYAAFGGYQNYVALWYQSLQAQGQQGQQQGQAGPPG